MRRRLLFALEPVIVADAAANISAGRSAQSTRQDLSRMILRSAAAAPIYANRERRFYSLRPGMAAIGK